MAYARWPDEATRNAFQHNEVEGLRLMGEAIAERFPEAVGTVVSDQLDEPE